MNTEQQSIANMLTNVSQQLLVINKRLNKQGLPGMAEQVKHISDTTNKLTGKFYKAFDKPNRIDP